VCARLCFMNREGRDGGRFVLSLPAIVYGGDAVARRCD
jgi:hypothetical protein